jgi:hypothetical protein
MNFPKPQTIFAYLIGFLFVFEILLYGSNLQAQESLVNSYSPLIDPILIYAHQIPEVVNRNKTHLSLYRYRNQSLETSPWQLDQVDDSGQIYLSNSRYNIPQRVSSRDQFLWMAEDMGEKAPEEVLKNNRWLELELSRGTGNNRWVYLRITPKEILPSAKQYISYRVMEDLVITPYYYLGYRNILIANRLGWVKPNKTLGPNQLNRVAVRFKARALFGLIPFKVTEDNLESEIVGFKDGAIRVIKRIKSSPKLPFGISGPSNITECYFYPHYFKTSVNIKFPIGSKAFFTQASFKIYVDLTQKKEDILITLPDEKTFNLSPNMEPKNYVIQKDPPTWMHFSSEVQQQTFAVRILLPLKVQHIFQAQSLMYQHDPKHNLNRDNSSSEDTMGSLSFEVDINSQKGEHEFNLFFYAPPKKGREKEDWTPKGEMQYLLATEDNPIKLVQSRLVTLGEK